MTEPTTPSVSVVIPTHNGGELLRRCLRSVLAQRGAPPFEVLVVDDGSTDRTPEMLRQDFPMARVIRRETNGGPGATRNSGWRAAGGDIVAFLDHDVTVAPEWLMNALRYFEDGSVGGVEGRTEVSHPERITPFTHWTKNLEGGQYPFCNMLLRRALLEDLGGFDERFYDPRRKVHFREDIELAFRALDRGWRLVYAPDAVAYHPPLPSTYARPLKLAQRYYFDPLLRRLHPARFAQAVEVHRIGPLALRRPRHVASFGNVLAALALAPSLLAGKRRLTALFAPIFVVSYAFSLAAAIRHNRLSKVPPRELVAALGVFLAVPWVYVWSYLRGLWAHRHAGAWDPDARGGQ